LPLDEATFRFRFLGVFGLFVKPIEKSVSHNDPNQEIQHESHSGQEFKHKLESSSNEQPNVGPGK
jgi:hypothetical protein